MPATPRTLAGVWAVKTAAFASRTLRRGGGTAVGGLVGLTVDPALVRSLAAQLGHGSVVITGTNGKTTTSRLVSAAARHAGLVPLTNASGSNLMRGITSTLALAAGATGRLLDAERHIGVFEVDEATVPEALAQLRPRVAVFTNLFRDQLDRYGEVEAVAARWRTALAATPDLKLVLNADDPSVASLGEGRADVLYFGVDDPALARGSLEHASDARTCVCGATLVFDIAYFSHIGHWRCPSCGRARLEPGVMASNLDLRDGRSLRFVLTTPHGSRDVEMAIGGMYNVYNALAATAAALVLNLPHDAVHAALGASTAAFGRQEAFEVDGRRVELLLSKNPAGLNQVLSTVMLDPARRAALLILNDNIADGRDISWVWDADFEAAAGKFERVIVSGTRAEDMALRFKYADWDEASFTVEPDIARALGLALAATPPGACLSVLPTYTAMLEAREILARRAGRAPFWDEAPQQ
jgi:UDP-N-acetylmuramyl tripeptide synthase